MATKKPVKKAPVKKTAAKKPVKKVVKKTTKPTKAAEMKSFRPYKDSQPFSRVQITRQTIYWTILLLFIVILQLWILKIQLDIADFTNLLLLQVDQ